METDFSKLGVDLEKIKDAALGDFDDYDSDQKVSVSNKSDQKQSISYAKTNNTGVSSALIEAALNGLDDDPNEKQDEQNKKQDEQNKKQDDLEKDKKQNDPNRELVNRKDTMDAGDSEWKDKFLSFHIVQLIVRLFTKDNLTILIWLFVNLLIITVPATIWLGWVGLLFGIGLFILSFGIALSPIGEFYLRFSNGCERLYGKKLGKKRGAKFEEIEQVQ